MHLLKSASPVTQIGPRGPTVSSAVQVASVQPWLVAAAVCHVSVTAMATLCKDTVTTRQASATVPTTLRDHIVSPACLVTMETPGKESFTLSAMHNFIYSVSESKNEDYNKIWIKTENILGDFYVFRSFHRNLFILTTFSFQ